MKYHTETRPAKMYFGSGRVYIADYVTDEAQAVWQELGALTAMSAQDAITTAKPEAVNCDHDLIVTGEESTITFTLQEIDPAVLKKCMGDLTEVTAVTASVVTGQEQILKPETGVLQLLLQQNHAAGSVKPAAPENFTLLEDDTPLTLDADYELVKDSLGIYGVILKKTPDTAKVYKATYDYTPVSQWIVTQGGASTIEKKMVKIVNGQNDGKGIELIYWKCQFSEGGSFVFQKDGDATPIDVPFTLKASLDRSRPEKQQLYKKIIT